MMKAKATLTFIGLMLVGSAVLSGCSVPAGVKDMKNMVEGATKFSDEDLMYAQMMIPHHEQAVAMAEFAVTRTSNVQVLAIAKKIKSAQAPEIAIMTAWLGGQVSNPHAGHGMQMPGMLTGAQLEELQNSVDSKFDSLFISGMIAHHEGAIEMTQSILKSENVIVREFSEKVVKDQTQEITELKSIG